MNGLISFWARNNVAANLLMITALLGGVFGFTQLEKEVFPSPTLSGAQVHVGWPGAAPQEVEEQIVVRIEEAVSDVDGVDFVTAYAVEGTAGVTVRALQSVDPNKFLDDVKLRVDSINNLPNSSFRPVVSQIRRTEPYMGLAIHGDIDPRALKRLTDGLRDEVARIPGAELAQAQGSLDEEVTIELSETAMRRFNLTFNEVAAAIRASSLNASGGDVRTDTGSINIQTRRLADTADQFGEITVRQTEDGGIIKLKDVATVIDGFVDADLRATYNSRLSNFIMFMPVDKMYLPQFSDEIKAWVDERNATMPEGVEIDILWSDDDFFSKLVSIISSSALQGTLLVLVILILFLRPVVAFWVSVGIITAFAGGFLLLPFMGVSLNLLTLFACLLVIGIVVDDAIVIGENIHTEVESGRNTGCGGSH